MTSTEREKYREKLRTLARRLSNEVSDLREESSHELRGEESDKYPAGTRVGDEQPSAKAEGEVVLHLLNNEQHILAQVQNALRRIDLDAFGTCDTCGGPIGRDRLEALPYAAKCVRCAGNGVGSRSANM